MSEKLKKKKILEESTLKQELFCQEWVDTIGNGTLAALKAFDIRGKEILNIPPPKLKDKHTQEELEENETYWKEVNRIKNVASSMATEYLRKPEIIKRIDEILEERAFNDDAVKREHFKLMVSGKDEVRIRAIDSYYKLKGKFIDKHDITSQGDKIGVIVLPQKNDNTLETNNQTGRSSSKK